MSTRRYGPRSPLGAGWRAGELEPRSDARRPPALGPYVCMNASPSVVGRPDIGSIRIHRLTASIEAPRSPVIEVRRSAAAAAGAGAERGQLQLLVEGCCSPDLDQGAANDPAEGIVESGVGGVVGRDVLEVARRGVEPEASSLVDVAEPDRPVPHDHATGRRPRRQLCGGKISAARRAVSGEAAAGGSAEMGPPDRIGRTRGDRDPAHRVRIGSGNGIRDSDGLLLAAIGDRRGTGGAPRVVVRRPSVRRGGRAIGAVRTVVYSEAGVPAGDHPTPADAPERGCGWPAASEVAVEPDWPSGYYEVMLTIDVDGKAPAQPRLLRRPPEPGNDQARILLALGDQHLARLQRLRRSQPLHRRHPGLAAAPDGARLPVQAARRRPAGDVAAPTGSAVASHVGYLR